MVPATETCSTATWWSGGSQHAGDPIVDEHIANAVLAETGRGVRLAKRKARNPMDAATALAIASTGAGSRCAGRPGRPTVSAL